MCYISFRLWLSEKETRLLLSVFELKLHLVSDIAVINSVVLVHFISVLLYLLTALFIGSL